MNRKLIIGLSIIALFAISTTVGTTLAQQTRIQTAFSFSMLSPNTSPARNQWSLLMEQTLPKIGISVQFHESTGWGNIGPRSWSYPLLDYDYIPTYAEGGYDMFFVGWSWGLDPTDLQGLYETSAIIPAGSNHYQYSSPVYDALLEDFLAAVDPVERNSLLSDIQEVLYDDLPAIAIVYPRSLFGFRDSVAGIDNLLIASSHHRAEYWDDPDDHILKYAIPGDLREFNSFVVESFYDIQWMQCVYGSIVQRAQNTHEWEPHIATDVVVSEIIDEKINVTVTLDPNAKFSDGSDLLPEDLKYTFELLMSPVVGSNQYGTLTYWFPSNDSIEIVGGPAGNVPGGQVLFKYSGVFNFPLSVLQQYIIDKSDVSAKIASFGYDIFNEVPGTGDVGWSLVKSCGPFMVQSYDSVGSVVHMVPNTHWHGTTPSLTDLYVTFIMGKDNAISELRLGNIDVMDAQYFPVLSDFEGEIGIEGVLVKDPSHQEMSFNMKHPVMGTGELTPLGTPEAAKYIRKAFSYACPRNVIVNEILQGLGAPATTAIPDSVVGYDDSLEPYPYDIDLAISMVEAAGFKVKVPVTEESGIAGLVFLTFLGVAALEAIRRYRK